MTFISLASSGPIIRYTNRITLIPNWGHLYIYKRFPWRNCIWCDMPAGKLTPPPTPGFFFFWNLHMLLLLRPVYHLACRDFLDCSVRISLGTLSFSLVYENAQLQEKCVEGTSTWLTVFSLTFIILSEAALYWVEKQRRTYITGRTATQERKDIANVIVDFITFVLQ